MHKIELVIALEQEKAAFLLGRYCSVFQQLPCSYTALRALAIIRQTPAVQVETAAAAAAIWRVFWPPRFSAQCVWITDLENTTQWGFCMILSRNRRPFLPSKSMKSVLSQKAMKSDWIALSKYSTNVDLSHLLDRNSLYLCRKCRNFWTKFCEFGHSAVLSTSLHSGLHPIFGLKRRVGQI